MWRAGRDGNRGIWRTITSAQRRYPGSFVLGFALLSALGLWRASRLTVVTDFAELLAPDQPSVVELRRVLARTPALSNVFVVLEGRDQDTLRLLADDLVTAVSALGPAYVHSVASGVQAARRFLLPRAGMFLTEEGIGTLRQQLREQERQEFRRRIGADLDDTGPASFDEQAFRSQLTARIGSLARYSDGYFQGASPTGLAIVVVVKCPVAFGDLGAARVVLARIRQTVASTMVAAGERNHGVKVGYAGDLVTSLEEYGLVRRDSVEVGLLGIVLVVSVLLLFFRSLRALLALFATIACGCALTFGVAERAFGHLNVASAFLFSIVAGNGVNFGIIWLARYNGERRAGRSHGAAAEAASERSFPATLASACAAAAAYAALGTSRFGAFQHFAVIGATGMLLCWATSYGLLPALVVLLDRPAPSGRTSDRTGRVVRPSLALEAPFVWLVKRAPGCTLVGGLVLAMAAVVSGMLYLARGPVEYDMRRMQSDPGATKELYRLSTLAAGIVGANTEGSMVVLTDDVRDTPLLTAALRDLRDKAPVGLRPFEDVHALHDFVPPRQEARLARLRELFGDLARMHDRGLLDDATWARWAPLIPGPGVGPFGVDDLPGDIVDPFTEKDGSRGRIVYIEPTSGENDSNLHYLLRWADAFRQTRLPDGRIVHGSGRAVIFADLLRASLLDMPRALGLSLAFTCATVVVCFRQPRAIGIVLASLGLALVWLWGALGAGDIRLSFMNFIALPISFGIGADYILNLYSRYRQDPAAGIVTAMRQTGGAVVLCSLTTCLGYLALLRAHSQGIRSLGLVAVLGEVTCLSTALLILPAALAWADGWRHRRGPPRLTVGATRPLEPPRL